MDEPAIRTLAEQPCVAVRVVAPMADIDIGALVGRHLGQLAGRLDRDGITVAGPPYVRYHAWGGETAVLELGFPIWTSAGWDQQAGLDAVPDETPGRTTLPGGRALVVEQRGPYTELPAAWARANAWLGEHGLQASGAPWESYVDNPDLVEPHRLLTEIVLPLEADA